MIDDPIPEMLQMTNFLVASIEKPRQLNSWLLSKSGSRFSKVIDDFNQESIQFFFTKDERKRFKEAILSLKQSTLALENFLQEKNDLKEFYRLNIEKLKPVCQAWNSTQLLPKIPRPKLYIKESIGELLIVVLKEIHKKGWNPRAAKDRGFIKNHIICMIRLTKEIKNLVELLDAIGVGLHKSPGENNLLSQLRRKDVLRNGGPIVYSETAITEVIAKEAFHQGFKLLNLRNQNDANNNESLEPYEKLFDRDASMKVPTIDRTQRMKTFDAVKNMKLIHSQ